MGLSNDEVAAILRLRDDAARAIGANQGAIAAALEAADQMRDIVSSPALHHLQDMHGRDLQHLRELRDASEHIVSQFGTAHVKAVADAFVGLTVLDQNQFSGGHSQLGLLLAYRNDVARLSYAEKTSASAGSVLLSPVG